MSNLTLNISTESRLEAQLEELLSEDIASVIKREQSTFDDLIAPFNKSLILYGAGNIGRQVLAYLRDRGIEPLAFADDDSTLWNTSIDGLQVMSVPDAALKYRRKVAFVATILPDNGVLQVLDFLRRHLAAVNCSKFAHVIHFFWKYSDSFLPRFNIDLPHKVYQQADEIRKCFSLWANEASRYEYLSRLRLFTHLDYQGLAAPTIYEEYFPDDLTTIYLDEVFVDCGAYDGDTIKALLRRQGSFFKQIISFEPDPVNFQKLQSYISCLPQAFRKKIDIHQLAVGACRGKVLFNATGTMGSAAGFGSDEVETVPLDEILADSQPTYIKMDLEGFELEALAGARNLIEQYSPVLAIALYHRQDHLWKIPLLVDSMSDQYRFFLRSQIACSMNDFNLYAIPVSRLGKHLKNQPK